MMKLLFKIIIPLSLKLIVLSALIMKLGNFTTVSSLYFKKLMWFMGRLSLLLITETIIHSTMVDDQSVLIHGTPDSSC